MRNGAGGTWNVDVARRFTLSGVVLRRGGGGIALQKIEEAIEGFCW